MIAWHPHPDVWLFILLLWGGYFYALKRWGPRNAPGPERPATSRQKLLFSLGALSIWAVLDWPMHELSENYLYSAHTVQHMVLALVAPPLLMLGTPPWLLRRLLGRGLKLEIVRRITRPLPALVTFNGMIALIHWPELVELMSRSELVHMTVHSAVIGSALIMWTPVLSPLLELPQLSYPGRMFYLFLQSLVPTVPASFLTFADAPFYGIYEAAPRIAGISALTDLQVAGLIMKIGGAAILWAIIGVLFFKWHALEQREGVDVLTWRDVDRELDRIRVDKR